MDKQTKGIIIGLVIGLVLGAVAGYILHNYIGRNFNLGRGSFQQLTQSQIDELNSFFATNPDATSVDSYCQQNRMNCIYYCRTINPSNEMCGQMMNYRNFSRGGV